MLHRPQKVLKWGKFSFKKFLNTNFGSVCGFEESLLHHSKPLRFPLSVSGPHLDVKPKENTSYKLRFSDIECQGYLSVFVARSDIGVSRVTAPGPSPFPLPLLGLRMAAQDVPPRTWRCGRGNPRKRGLHRFLPGRNPLREKFSRCWGGPKPLSPSNRCLKFVGDIPWEYTLENLVCRIMHKSLCISCLVRLNKLYSKFTSSWKCNAQSEIDSGFLVVSRRKCEGVRMDSEGKEPKDLTQPRTIFTTANIKLRWVENKTFVRNFRNRYSI